MIHTTYCVQYYEYLIFDKFMCIYDYSDQRNDNILIKTNLSTPNIIQGSIKHHRIYNFFIFESTIDHKVNISDVDNSIDVDTFVYVYDHKSQ